MAHFIVERADGTVAVMQTAGDVTPEECVAKWAPAAQDAVASITEVAPGDLPAGRVFREAWRRNGSRVIEDMTTCREIHLGRIRAARDAELREKDREWLVAFSRGDTATADAIEVERQSLRDITQTIEPLVNAARTTTELKAVWPAELSARKA